MDYPTRIEKLNTGQWARVGDGTRVYVTGPDDTTAGERITYDADCAQCWLGFGHSGDYHRRALAAKAHADAMLASRQEATR